LKLPGLPGPIKDQYKVHLKPFFSYLEGNGAYKVPRNMQQMMDGEIERIYDQCINFLKENVSYCFQSRQPNPMNWALGTWSIKTQCLTILKKGIEADKAKVAEATNWNCMRRPNTQPDRQMATNHMYRYRQHQHLERLIRNNQQQETTQDDEENFCNAFQNAELSEATHARDEEIHQQVDAEL
jgi:hypothetical protein